LDYTQYSVLKKFLIDCFLLRPLDDDRNHERLVIDFDHERASRGNRQSQNIRCWNHVLRMTLYFFIEHFRILW
jgi:hypothetical protein